MILSSYTPVQYDKEKHGNHESCSICIGEFEDTSKIKILNCSHLFHEVCIDEWITKS